MRRRRCVRGASIGRNHFATTAPGATVPRTLIRRVPSWAVLGGALILLAAAGCGGGGGGGGGDSGDLAQEAAEIDAILDRIEALGESTTTQQAFSQELQQISAEVQTAVEEVHDADAPEELEAERDKLANRLLSLRTQLSRAKGLADGGDLEAAQAAIGSFLSIGEIRETIENIQAAPSER
jgi:soluble cytochrome b562